MKKENKMKGYNVFYSICTMDHSACAAIVNDSLKRAGHSEQQYVLFVDYDPKRKGVLDTFKFVPVSVDELRVPQVHKLIEKHTVSELSVVLKPFFEEWLLKEHPQIKNLIYIDCLGVDGVEMTPLGADLDVAKIELSLVKQELDSTTARLRSAHEELQTMQRSLGWKFVLYTRRVLNSVMPGDSLRKKIMSFVHTAPPQRKPLPVMKEGPLVTVVTTTYNLIKAGREKTFRQCVASVHDQSYTNIEHIIIDGGSKDGTVELLEEYSKKGWITYISEPDGGMYDAMNKGARIAKGTYIIFLNSDDYFHDTDGVGMSVAALVKTKSTFSYAPVVNLDDSLNMSSVCVPDMSKVFFMAVPNHQTMFYDRMTIINEGLFNTEYTYAADYDLTIRLCLRGYTSVFVGKDFSTYRLGGHSFHGTKQGLAFVEISDIYFKNYNKLCPLTKAQSDRICGGVFHGSYSDMPPMLARKLKEFPQYFDYSQYLRSTGVRGVIKKYLKLVFVRIPRYLLRRVRYVSAKTMSLHRKILLFIFRKEDYFVFRRHYFRFLTIVFFWLPRGTPKRNKRLLIVRPDNIGDFIIFSAVLRHIRSLYQGYDICFLGNERISEFVGWFDEVDTFVPLNVDKFKFDQFYYVKTFWKLRRDFFDVVLCPMYSRSFMGDELVRMANSPEKVGVDGDDSSQPERDRQENNSVYTRLVKSPATIITEVERNKILLRSLGYKGNDDMVPKIEVQDDWLEKAESVLVASGWSGKKYVVVHMGAGGPSRIWPADKYAEVVQFLVEKDLAVVFTGTKDEQYLFDQQKARCSKGELVNLMGKTSLNVTAAVLKKACMYFGAETGTLHLASAVGCKTVCLLGGGHFGRFFPYGDLNKNRIAYDKHMKCKNDNWVCTAQRQGKTAICIENIRVEDALSEIKSSL